MWKDRQISEINDTTFGKFKAEELILNRKDIL
jgi:hypothetical protein